MEAEKFEQLIEKLDRIDRAVASIKQPDVWPEFINRQDLAAKLGVTTQSIAKWEKRGILQGVRVGHVIRYSRENVNQALARMEKLKYYRTRKDKSQGVDIQ